MTRFHNRVIVLATTIASQLQGLASAYRLDVMSKDLVKGKTVTRENIKKVVTIDLETEKTLEYTETVGKVLMYICAGAIPIRA